LGENDTGTVLARCHIWANPYRNGSPAAQGRVRHPYRRLRSPGSQYLFL